MALAAPETRPAFGATAVCEAPRVAVFRGLRGVGDMLVAGPALRVLRAALPHAHIALIGVEDALPVVDRMRHLFDEFVTFPGWPGLPEGAPPRATPRIGYRRARQASRSGNGGMSSPIEDWCGADAVVQMHGDGTLSNGFCASLDPRMLVAYGPAVTRGDCELHTSTYPRVLHEIDRCLDVATRAAKLLGGQVGPLDRTLEFAVTEQDRREAAGVLSGLVHDGEPYFVLHPGSHLPDRRWPAARFAEIGGVLARHGVVLVSGGGSERTLAHETALAIGPRAFSIAGDTTLGGIAAVLQGSRGLVTNDTGISHLADAVRTPSVVVFMASDPHRWAPLDWTLHVPVVAPALDGEEGTLTPEGIRLSVPETACVLEAVTQVGMVPEAP